LRPLHGDEPRLGKLSDPYVPGNSGGDHRPDRPAQRGSMGWRRTFLRGSAFGNWQRRFRGNRRQAAFGTVHYRQGQGSVRGRMNLIYAAQIDQDVPQGRVKLRSTAVANQTW